MDKTLLDSILAQMPLRQVIGLTAIGEADCLGLRGMTATINTGQNRVNSGVTRFGSDLVGVFTWPKQYDVWLPNNPRLPSLLKMTEDDPMLSAAMVLADQALAGTLEDITHGATHYYNHLIVNPPPSWGTGTPLFVIEPHFFFRTAPY